MSDATGPEAQMSLPLDGPALQRPSAARRWVAARCAALGVEPAGQDLALLVSELVTNASIHAREPVCLRLTIDLRRGRVRIEVEDGSPITPTVRRPGSRSAGGRGMLIVESLSRSWGTEPTDTGKVVWAEVPIGTTTEPAPHPSR